MKKEDFYSKLEIPLETEMIDVFKMRFSDAMEIIVKSEKPTETLAKFLYNGPANDEKIIFNKGDIPDVTQVLQKIKYRTNLENHQKKILYSLRCSH